MVLQRFHSKPLPNFHPVFHLYLALIMCYIHIMTLYNSLKAWKQQITAWLPSFDHTSMFLLLLSVVSRAAALWWFGLRSLICLLFDCILDFVWFFIFFLLIFKLEKKNLWLNYKMHQVIICPRFPWSYQTWIHVWIIFLNLSLLCVLWLVTYDHYILMRVV